MIACLILLLLYNQISASFLKLFAISLRVSITSPFAIRAIFILCFRGLSLTQQELRIVKHSFVLLVRKSWGAENRIIPLLASFVRVSLSTFRMKVQS